MYFYLKTQARQTAPAPFRDGFLFRGSMVWIGNFNCAYTHQEFSGTQYFSGHHMVVFPRTSVKLNMVGRASIISSPNLAIFYNYQTVYERHRLNDERDCCDYFQFCPTLLTEIMAFYEADTVERPSAPFSFTHAFVRRDLFLHQRKLVDAIWNDKDVDVLKIDEAAVFLLEKLIADSFAQRGRQKQRRSATARAHRQLAFDAQELLATRFDEQLTLQQIADTLYVSPYHLSRVFRQQTGCTLHHYLEQLRLRIAYERLGDYRQNLLQLALDVGYTTHSHFSQAFHQNFGQPPSAKIA